MKKLLIALFIFIAALACIQYNTPDHPSKTQKDSESYIPRADFVRLLSIGHNNALATLYWASAIVNLGDSYLTGVKYKWFFSVANLVSQLDPQWKRVYEFTGSMADGNDPQIDSVMVQGLKYYPDDWRMATYYAMHLVNQRKDYKRASEVMKPFETRTDIPNHIPRMSKSFASFTMPKETAIQITLEDYFNPHNAGFKRGVARRMLKLLNHSHEDSDLNNMIQLLEQVPQRKMHPEQLYKILLQGVPF